MLCELHWPLPPVVTEITRPVAWSICGEPESPKHSPEPVPMPLFCWNFTNALPSPVMIVVPARRLASKTKLVGPGSSQFGMAP
jgi:hypothetical protein